MPRAESATYVAPSHAETSGAGAPARPALAVATRTITGAAPTDSWSPNFSGRRFPLLAVSMNPSVVYLLIIEPPLLRTIL